MGDCDSNTSERWVSYLFDNTKKNGMFMWRHGMEDDGVWWLSMSIWEITWYGYGVKQSMLSPGVGVYEIGNDVTDWSNPLIFKG